MISSINLRFYKNFGSFKTFWAAAQLSSPTLNFLPKTPKTASIVKRTPLGGVYIIFTSLTLSGFNKLKALLAF